MINVTTIENYFNEFYYNTPYYLPEGLIPVDIDFLQKYHLLNFHQEEETTPLTQYFHVIETLHKITLFNEHYAIWILPAEQQENPSTTVFIALLNEGQLQLEIGFLAKGIYNNSKLVLRVLEKLLEEIEENEQVLKNLRG
ncbi:MAG: hypothetical protein KDK65_00655 [Chlamydiia bacterium]|nr:hypothetical protein [Chlamydiia bacterium]